MCDQLLLQYFAMYLCYQLECTVCPCPVVHVQGGLGYADGRCTERNHSRELEDDTNFYVFDGLRGECMPSQPLLLFTCL